MFDCILTNLRELQMEEDITIIIVMGVCGSGKTTVGQLLAKKLQWSFSDADEFHSEENKQKMASGQPLTDQDRLPWLLNIHHHIKEKVDIGQPAVVTCSALKKHYRQILLHGSKGSPDSNVKPYTPKSESRESEMASYSHGNETHGVAKANNTQSDKHTNIVTKGDNNSDKSLEQRELSNTDSSSSSLHTHIKLPTHKVLFVLLKGTFSVLEKRMSNRQGHFMPGSLLTSQLETLEYPDEQENSITVDVDKSVELIVDEIITKL